MHLINTLWYFSKFKINSSLLVPKHHEDYFNNEKSALMDLSIAISNLSDALYCYWFLEMEDYIRIYKKLDMFDKKQSFIGNDKISTKDYLRDQVN
jgi:hypothetical protein